MKREQFNQKLRILAKTLSPTEAERNMISKIYSSINDSLGVNNCIQIGSFPRKTSVTPVHDLDVLYIIGDWNENEHSPVSALKQLHKLIGTSYENPTPYNISTSLQSHSVTIAFTNNGKEIFSVDIVPAFRFMKNEFGDNTYKVPEVIIAGNHKRRTAYYNENKNREMNWITSDPRGYISLASEVGVNPDFRKTVKFVKRWKNCLSEATQGELKLKSFHVEQVITGYFKDVSNLDMFDAIFEFFYNLPSIINKPNQIADRANREKFIDDYLSQFNSEQKQQFKHARDGFLVRLENIKSTNSIDELFKIEFYKRSCSEESFLFDQYIKMLVDESSTIKIIGQVEPRIGGFRGYILNKTGLLDIDRRIKFEAENAPNADLLKWKVKNDNRSAQPRGEITDHRTKNNPEKTSYKGNHYVECFAIQGNECIASYKQLVVLE